MMIFVMHLTRVTFTEGLDKGLRLNSSLAGQLLLNFSPDIKDMTKSPGSSPFILAYTNKANVVN